MTDAWNRLATARIATLGTIRRDGAAHLIPCVFAISDNQIITAIDHKPKTTRQLARLTNIAHDPRVTLLAHHYEDDWHQLWWVRVDGLASISSEPPEILASLIAKYAQYQDHPPEGPFITIEASNISTWSS